MTRVPVAMTRGTTHFWVDCVRPYSHREANSPCGPARNPLAVQIVEWLKTEGHPVQIRDVTRRFGCDGERLRSLLDTVTYDYPVYQDDGEVGCL